MWPNHRTVSINKPWRLENVTTKKDLDGSKKRLRRKAVEGDVDVEGGMRGEGGGAKVWVGRKGGWEVISKSTDVAESAEPMKAFRGTLGVSTLVAFPDTSTPITVTSSTAVSFYPITFDLVEPDTGPHLHQPVAWGGLRGESPIQEFWMWFKPCLLVQRWLYQVNRALKSPNYPPPLSLWQDIL